MSSCHLGLGSVLTPVKDSSKEIVATERPEATSGDSGIAAPPVWPSLEELEKQDTISERVMSEVAGVELVAGSSGAVYLLASKDKTIPKRAQLGGYGTGQYVNANAGEGVPYEFPTGDQELVQFDECSLKPDSSNVETMTLYKLIVTVEKAKKLAAVNMSFLDALLRCEALRSL